MGHRLSCWHKSRFLAEPPSRVQSGSRVKLLTNSTAALRRNPQGQAIAGPKCLVIFTPIAQRETQLGNMMVPFDVVFVSRVMDWLRW